MKPSPAQRPSPRSSSAPPPRPERVQVLLYEDPNDDGLPHDGVLLTSAEAFPDLHNELHITEVAIDPTPVDGSFFIAVLYEFPDQSPSLVPIDLTDPDGTAWSAFGDQIDVNDLASTNLDNPGVALDFFARAVGVPAPATALPLLSVAMARRRRSGPRYRSTD